MEAVSTGSGGAADSGGSAGGDSGGSSGGDSGGARQVAPPSAPVQQNGAATKPAEQKPGTAAQQAAAKLRAKRGGKEVEYDHETASRMLSDDYEHEFPGPGGTPVKLKWDGVTRAVQQSHGWQARMREAAQIREQHQRDMELARGDIPAFIEARLIDRNAKDGPKNFDDLATAHVAKLHSEYLELQEMQERYVQGADGQLYQNPRYNPMEAQNRIQAKAAAALERQQKLDKMIREREDGERTERANAEQNRKVVADALGSVGLKANKYTMAIAEDIYKEHAEIDAVSMLTVQHLAQLTLDRYRKELVDEHVNGLDDDGLMGWLGDERSKRIQEILVARAKGQKREERAATREQQQSSASSSSTNGSTKGMTEAEIKRKHGWR